MKPVLGDLEMSESHLSPLKLRWGLFSASRELLGLSLVARSWYILLPNRPASWISINVGMTQQ